MLMPPLSCFNVSSVSAYSGRAARVLSDICRKSRATTARSSSCISRKGNEPLRLSSAYPSDTSALRYLFAAAWARGVSRCGCSRRTATIIEPVISRSRASIVQPSILISRIICLWSRLRLLQGRRLLVPPACWRRIHLYAQCVR